MAHQSSSGLPPGATLLPGRQIPPRAERPDGVAARWDPAGPAMHATLLRTLRKTATNHQGRGETPARVRRSETGRLWWVLTCCSLSQLLQAFYQQQEEIRELREQLQHKDVSIWDVLTSLLMCLGCDWQNQTRLSLLFQATITQLELKIKNTRNNLRATFWLDQSASMLDKQQIKCCWSNNTTDEPIKTASLCSYIFVHVF